MLAFCNNSNAVYRLQNPVDTSHTYVPFLPTKTLQFFYYFRTYVRHAHISPRPADTSHICLSLCQQPHIAHICQSLQTHTLPQYFTMLSIVISYLPSILFNRSILQMLLTSSSNTSDNFFHSVQNTHLTNTFFGVQQVHIFLPLFLTLFFNSPAVECLNCILFVLKYFNKGNIPVELSPLLNYVVLYKTEISPTK
jgi:hypothetical protein